MSVKLSTFSLFLLIYAHFAPKVIAAAVAAFVCKDFVGFECVRTHLKKDLYKAPLKSCCIQVSEK